MRLVQEMIDWVRREWMLVTLLLLAFTLRIFGVGYGLPLTVVNDEPPFTLVALKMIQLQTLIPAFNPEAFASIILYPLYLSFVLVIPFVVILGVLYLGWDGSTELFEATLLTDLSPFFLTARVVSTLLGVFMVYLVYRIAESLFHSKIAAITAGFLVATSILAQALSMVGRVWTPSSVVLLLVLFILTRDIPKVRRYLYALIVAGIGMGFSTLSALALPLIALYYFLFDCGSWRTFTQDIPRMTPSVLLFSVLAAIPFVLYNKGNAFFGAVTIFADKTRMGLIESPWSLLSLTVYSEPVLIGLALLGMMFLLRSNRAVFVLCLGWFLMYVAIFYLFFRFDARFALPLIPFYAIAGGYVIERLWNKRTAVILCLVLLVPLIVAARVEYLALQGDTREHARAWVLENLEPTDKVLVYVALMRLPTTASALEELRAIDASVVRKTDEADAVLDRTDVPHTLNHLFPMRRESAFIQNIAPYARANDYTHLVFGPEYAAEATSTAAAFAPLLAGATEIYRLDGRGREMSVAFSAFTRPLFELFDDRLFGPTIIVYALP